MFGDCCNNGDSGDHEGRIFGLYCRVPRLDSSSRAAMRKCLEETRMLCALLPRETLQCLPSQPGNPTLPHHPTFPCPVPCLEHWLGSQSPSGRCLPPKTFLTLSLGSLMCDLEFQNVL
jgi:hypothetical protein